MGNKTDTSSDTFINEFLNADSKEPENPGVHLPWNMRASNARDRKNPKGTERGLPLSDFVFGFFIGSKEKPDS